MTSLFKKLSILLLIASFATMAGFSANAAETEEDAAILIDLKTERAVIRAIHSEPRLASSPIIIGCVDGIITLQGSVETGIEKELAAKLAESVDGVQGVKNYLTTQS